MVSRTIKKRYSKKVVGCMEAIILAGGFGSRLRHAVDGIPKPMAPINNEGKPFLSVLLEMLKKNRFSKIVLSVGYLGDVIQSYYGDDFQGIPLLYSVEQQPLYTGGAAKKALKMCTEDNVFLINGDTFFHVDYEDMLCQHKEKKADFSVAIKKMYHFSRYGTILLQGDRIVSFIEKKYCHEGWINGGLYCLKRDLLENVESDRFSLEHDYMERCLSANYIIGYPSAGFFIDIGIPDDYYKAREYFEGGTELVF